MPRSLRVLVLLASLGFLVPGVLQVVRGEVIGGVALLVTGGVVAAGPLASLRRPSSSGTAVPEGEPRDITAGSTRPWVAIGVLLVVLGGITLWRSQTTTVLPLYLSAFGAVVVVQARRFRANVVRFDDDALVVVTRAGEKTYAWDDVLELSWSPLYFPTLGVGPVVRVRGGSFDSPGPIVPAQVAMVPIWGAAARADARDQVRRAAAAHGITFTDGLSRLVESGKRPARFPGERP